MTTGETWMVRDCGDAFAFSHPVIHILEKFTDGLWQVGDDYGDFAILTSAYIFENYQRDYSK